MANLVTAGEVDQIMDLDSGTPDETVEVFIDMAHAMVDDILGTDTTLGTTLKKMIEKNLAAHFIANTIARMGAVERLGEARIDYTGVWGKGLESTPYGQNVLTLDSTGKMSNSGKGRAYIKAIGGWND